jgi:acyl-CoA thioester hydrolase
MTNFPIRFEIPVAWGDMDAFGHVNNVIYLRYFETARVRYFDNLISDNNNKSSIKPVLASIQANYKAPVVYPDILTVKIGVTKMGMTSLNMCCEMFNQRGTLALEANCAIVMFDFITQKPSGIPDEIKEYIRKIEKNDTL